MGDMSVCNDWNLEIKDIERFKEWVKEPTPKWIAKMEKGELGNYEASMAELKDLINNHPSLKGDEAMEELAKIIGEGKILSYWYTGYCTWLRELALHVEGHVWNSLYSEALGEILFKNGECFVKQMNLSAQTGVEIEKFTKRNQDDMPKIPIRVKLMRKL